MNLQQALVPLGLALLATGAQAAPTRDAIRVTLDGQTRIVRTLGRPTDAEFYAPLAKPLRSLGLDVQATDLGDIEVRYQGNRVARWPVVTREDQLPAVQGTGISLPDLRHVLPAVHPEVATFVRAGDVEVRPVRSRDPVLPGPH